MNPSDAIGLKNVALFHKNAKEEKGKYDFIVSRAVMITRAALSTCGRAKAISYQVTTSRQNL